MISASKTTFRHYNLKILRLKVTKNLTNLPNKFCEFRPGFSKWLLRTSVRLAKVTTVSIKTSQKRHKASHFRKYVKFFVPCVSKILSLNKWFFSAVAQQNCLIFHFIWNNNWIHKFHKIAKSQHCWKRQKNS